jgi:hypothetical protein
MSCAYGKKSQKSSVAKQTKGNKNGARRKPVCVSNNRRERGNGKLHGCVAFATNTYSPQIIKKLGKGAQGSVFLCEDKITHTNYVMKKVECNDEGEANKAFKEVYH